MLRRVFSIFACALLMVMFPSREEQREVNKKFFSKLPEDLMKWWLEYVCGYKSIQLLSLID